MYTRLAACPNCGKNSFTNEKIISDYAVSNEGFAIVSCDNCKLWFTNPIPSSESRAKYEHDKEQILSIRKQFYVGLRTKRKAHIELRRIVQLINTAREKKRLLDYYSQDASHLSRLDSQWTIAKLTEDPMEQSAQGTDLHHKLEELPKKKFDVITAFHSLSYQPDLLQSLSDLRKLLHKNGRLIIIETNKASGLANHYGDHWAGYDLPRKLYHFDTKSMKDVAKRSKLKLKETIALPVQSWFSASLSEAYKGSNEPKKEAKKTLRLIQADKETDYPVLLHILAK